MAGKPLTASRAPKQAPRVAVCRTPLWDTALPETVHAIEDAASRLAAAGAQVRDIDLPEAFTRLYHAARETINNYERARAMAGDWATDGDRISKVLGDRIREGMVMPYADYRAALALGEECRARIEETFADIDIILAPSVKGEAPVGLATTGDPAFQAFWTILHVPTITLPTHRGPTGLPVGIQLVAPRYEDDRLFACARWVFERLGRG
jgi:Asp-tRNA(Asn)/Glu-tRNA(Gln) amidotransferase A subunit family amidase